MASHSVTEAAKLAGVTRRTIYRHIKAGKLSASVTGGDNTVIETSELLRVYGALSQPEPGGIHWITRKSAWICHSLIG
jgi:excisionase family DNA binding protein